MKDDCFINIALDSAIKSYIDSKETKDGLVYQSFLVVVIRALSFIYSEIDIINAYYLNNSVAFINNLSKFGMSKMEITSFLEDLLRFYQLDEKNKKRQIKEKNPYFIQVQKYLVDMFLLKKQNHGVSYLEEEQFLELLYTPQTKNAYRYSYNYLMTDDIGYIEKYYYSKANHLDVTRVDLNETMNKKLNLESLKYVGVNLGNLSNMSNRELFDAQDKAYQYFQVDVSNVNRENDLKEKIDFYKYNQGKITTGNGYVDILLLMSIIVTSLSVFLIVIFHFM